MSYYNIQYRVAWCNGSDFRRTPDRMFKYAKEAHQRGLKVIIAGAGGAAHLPGMVASLTALPVIGKKIFSEFFLHQTSNKPMNY